MYRLGKSCFSAFSQPAKSWHIAQKVLNVWLIVSLTNFMMRRLSDRKFDSVDYITFWNVLYGLRMVHVWNCIGYPRFIKFYYFDTNLFYAGLLPHKRVVLL